ncbi:MAG TPA: ATP-binding protein, partial [Candidatus Obscuribacter sp.]|nr:ATP-binding protein [Candidatus Obscuribacter sp.]
RYLLTMLDALESESNKRVCIMMTTMDVASVPPALVRSGRIELWLETRLPDNEARLKILIDQAHRLPPELRSYDPLRLAEITDGLTGADLKRLIEDAKILLAYDKSRNVECEDLFSYFERATETIRSNKLKYEAAEERSKQRAPSMKEALEAAFSSMGGYGFDTDNFPD